MAERFSLAEVEPDRPPEGWLPDELPAVERRLAVEIHKRYRRGRRCSPLDLAALCGHAEAPSWMKVALKKLAKRGLVRLIRTPAGVCRDIEPVYPGEPAAQPEGSDHDG